MNVTYAANAQQWGEDYRLMQRATRRLEEIVGPSAESATMTWDRVTDPSGHLRYRLTLKDSHTQVGTEFEPEELRDALYMRLQLFHLWGDMLQRQSDEQHKIVQTMLSQIGNGQEGE